MLAELAAALAAAPETASREDYEAAIVEGNCLGKTTTATRRQPTSGLASFTAWTREFRSFGCSGDSGRSTRPAAKLHGLSPQTYLAHVLTRIADTKPCRIEDLLPWHVASTLASEPSTR